MHFWPHGGDLSRPPRLKDLKRRNPWGTGPYWDCVVFSQEEALGRFWAQWLRTTKTKLAELKEVACECWAEDSVWFSTVNENGTGPVAAAPCPSCGRRDNLRRVSEEPQHLEIPSFKPRDADFGSGVW